MNSYEKLLITKEEKDSVIVNDLAELPSSIKGFYIETKNKNIILINKNVKSIKEKRCIFAEEIGHLKTTSGDITDQSKIENRKQEVKARRWAYEKLVGIINLINAYEYGVRNRYELAEYLDVTEEFIEEAIRYYKEKYGPFYQIDNYIVYFEPLSVLEMWE